MLALYAIGSCQKGNKGMFQANTNEQPIDWLLVHGIAFKRKLENETAFDGIVKIYSIKTDNEKINRALKGLYFGDFSFITVNGILMRKFRNKDSWPKTILTHLEIQTGELKIVKETKSSYLAWSVDKQSDGKYKIRLSPTETVDFIDWQ
jgi:hypothetical protein